MYKLHGCISRPDVDLVFSLEEYAQYKEAHLKLFNQLSIDLVDSPVIFIGYSGIDSNFQDTLATINKYCDTTTRKNNYFFVGPHIKASQSEYLASNGFVQFNMGIDEFSEHISNLTAGRRTTLRDYYVQNNPKLDLFEKASVEPELAYKLSQDYQFPNYELSKNHLKNITFYNGSYPMWGDIKNNLDAKRDILEDLIFGFENWYANPKPAIWMITGRAGDGKSTILKRFAAEVSNRIGEHCLFSKPRASLDPVQLEKLQKLIDKPLVLFVDNTTDRIFKVNQLISRFRTKKSNVLIVGAARTSDWYSNINDFFSKPSEFPMGKLSDSEIGEILSQLEKNSALQALEDKTPEQRFEIFKDKSERELIVALCEATSGLSLNEIIANEYTSLKSEDAKRAYLHICLIHQFRYRLPQSLFLRVLEFDPTTVKTDVFDYTHDVIFSDEANEAGDFLLRSRHAVISGIVCQYYFRDNVKKVDFLTAIFRDHVPSNPLEASLVKKLYHHTTIRELFEDVEIGSNCYDHLGAEVPNNQYLLQQKALYLAYYTNDYPAAKDAIKEAIRLDDTSNILHHTHGTILMKQAIQERDSDKSKYYLEEGKRILLRGARKNSNNVYNFHTLINHLIKWHDKSDLDDNNLILEIQELVDEASTLHPNDSLILTEHGKLHELLKDSNSSKAYFERAININRGNSAARYLLAKILISEGNLTEAFNICDEGVKIKPEEVQINRLRLELIHSMNILDAKDIIREYEDYLHNNPKDSFTKLCYASWLYSIGNKKCDRVFRELRELSGLSHEDKFMISADVNKITGINLTEEATVVADRASGYLMKNHRFECKTLVFLSNNLFQGLNNRDRIKYTLQFNYLGPNATAPRRLR